MKAEKSYQLSADQKREVLDELLESETFARSDQLRSFLAYIGDMAISGRSREITEYLIAVEALHRPADFSPSADSSVRSHAHELRRKLQKYYEVENPRAEIRVVLPKGVYCPRFVLRDEAAGFAEAAELAAIASKPELVIGETPLAPALPTEIIPAPPPVLSPAANGSRWRTLALALCLAAIPVAAWLGYSAGRQSAAPGFDPILQKAWGPLTRPDADVILCVATPLNLLVRPYMSVVAEGLSKYPAPPELYGLFRQHRPLPPGIQLDMHPTDNAIQMGHVSGVVTLSNALHEGHVRYQVLPERSARVTAMRGRNVILVGDPQDSEAAAFYLDSTPVTLEYDRELDDVVVRDRRPGRQKTYAPIRGQDRKYTEVYGLITVTPTPDATADQRTVVISGLTSVGAQGAAEFFASAKSMQSLLDRFRAEGRPTFPSGYQVVIRCASRDTQLVSTEFAGLAVFRP